MDPDLQSSLLENLSGLLMVHIFDGNPECVAQVRMNGVFIKLISNLPLLLI